MTFETTVVRYGNARLTVASSGSVTADDELGRALARHEAGEAGAEEVAWAYVRTRTVEHSPSFTWSDAQLPKLIELVTGVSANPKIEAKTPATLAKFLVDERRTQGAAATPAAAAPAAAPTAAAAAPVRAVAQPTPSSSKTSNEKVSKRSRLARLFPKRTLWRVVLGLGIVLLVAAYFAGRYYMNEVPDQLADDYREETQPTTEKVTDAMDRAFAAFDRYLANSTLPRREIRNADDVAEIKRRFLPLYDDTKEALEFGSRAVKSAQKVLKSNRDGYEDTPSSFLLNEKDAVVETKDAAETTGEYFREANRFLDNFEEFIEYEEQALALRREETEDLGGSELPADASIEEVKSTLADDLARAKQNREELLDIKPHPDQEKYFDVEVEFSTLAVDYLEDVLAGYNALSLPQIRAADDDYFSALKPLRDDSSYLLAVFASKSSLQTQSRKVEKLGDELEKRVAALGTGDGDLVRPDRIRKPAPPAPPKPDGGGSAPGGEGEPQQS